jgi:hypothetical protein
MKIANLSVGDMLHYPENHATGILLHFDVGTGHWSYSLMSPSTKDPTAILHDVYDVHHSKILEGISAGRLRYIPSRN